MDINLDDLSSEELTKELEKTHKELLATDPNYKGSSFYNEVEERIKENKMLQDVKNVINAVDTELELLAGESKIPKSIKKELKTHRAELVIFCHQMKKLEPKVDEPLTPSDDESRMTRSIYYLKAKMTIRKIDKLL